MFGNKIKEGTRIPKHIALIMDGNGRWAKKRMLPRSMGHKQGMERMIGLLEHAYDLGVSYVTVYALSTENLRRPQEELEGLYKIDTTKCRQPIYVNTTDGEKLLATVNMIEYPLNIKDEGDLAIVGKAIVGKSILKEACSPPFKIFIIGVGKDSFFLVKYLYK